MSDKQEVPGAGRGRADVEGHRPTPPNAQRQRSAWQETDEADPAAVWDRRFSNGEWSTEPDTELMRLASAVRPGTVLDLGAGNGRNAIWLAAHGWSVTCVDSSPVGLGQAQARAASVGVRISTEVADLRSWELGGRQFDLVVLANLHLPPEHRRRLFRMAQAAVAPGGRLFVIGHRVGEFGRHGGPPPERLFTEALLSELIDQLEIEELRTVDHLADHGHGGTDIVVWARRAAGS